MRNLWVFLVCLCIQGCGLAHATQELSPIATSGIWQIREQNCVKDKLTRKNAVKQQDCLFDLFMEWATVSNYPYPATAMYYLSDTKKGAALYAKGKINQDQFLWWRENNKQEMLKAQGNMQDSDFQYEMQERAALMYQRLPKSYNTKCQQMAWGVECDTKEK